MLRYSQAEWRAALATQPFTQISAAIERERCAGDLLYAVFQHPETPLPNGRTVIQHLICVAFETIARKYAPDFEQSRMIREARAYVTHPTLSDVHVKTFYFLFMLQRETELQEVVARAYVEGKHLWGTNEEARAHLKTFLDEHLGGMVQRTLDWPCSVLNIVDVVRNMVRAAAKAYLTGK